MTGLALVATLMIGSLALVGTASADRADPLTTTPDERAPSEAFEVWAEHVPVACRAYAWLPADVRDDTFGWNQLLSLAACLQPASDARVTDPAQLPVMVEGYLRGLELPMMIYASAIEDGPRAVKLRAAYQFAMVHVTLIVRARNAIVVPVDLATNPEAAQRYRELHAQLEPLLARSARVAWISFAIIDRAVAQDARLAPDAVTRNMVRSARAMLALMPQPAEEREPPEPAPGEPI